MAVSPPEDVQGLVAELVRDKGSDPSQLLQHLYRIQYRYSHVPESAIAALSRALSVSTAQIQGLIEFYAFLHTEPRGEFDILFSDSITDHMLGSRQLCRRLCERLGVELDRPRANGRVSVATTSCTGMCDQGPALLVNGLALTRVDADRVDHIAALVEG
jgi:[NiFe] hydrogenase diaphorase moiety large subunit